MLTNRTHPKYLKINKNFGFSHVRIEENGENQVNNKTILNKNSRITKTIMPKKAYQEIKKITEKNLKHNRNNLK